METGTLFPKEFSSIEIRLLGGMMTFSGLFIYVILIMSFVLLKGYFRWGFFLLFSCGLFLLLLGLIIVGLIGYYCGLIQLGLFDHLG